MVTELVIVPKNVSDYQKALELQARVNVEGDVDLTVMAPEFFDPVTACNEDFLLEGLKAYIEALEDEDQICKTWQELCDDIKLWLWVGLGEAIESAERAAGWDPNP